MYVFLNKKSSWNGVHGIQKKRGFQKQSPDHSLVWVCHHTRGGRGHWPTTWGQWWFTVVDVGVGCGMYICPFEKLLISNWLRA